jgi:hypothetical protein
MRVGSKGGKDTADIGALERIGYLHPEETEADVP